MNQESGPKRTRFSFSGDGTRVSFGRGLIRGVTSSGGVTFKGDWFWTNPLLVIVRDDPPPYPEYGLGTTVGGGGVPFSSI